MGRPVLGDVPQFHLLVASGQQLILFLDTSTKDFQFQALESPDFVEVGVHLPATHCLVTEMAILPHSFHIFGSGGQA